MADKTSKPSRPQAGGTARGRDATQVPRGPGAQEGKDKAAHGEDHLGGRALGLSTNDKTKRQFRRKSGG